MSSELWPVSPVPPPMSPLRMWPASSTMSDDLSTAFATMSRAASIASFGLKAIAVSFIYVRWLSGLAGVRWEASANAVREPAAGQLPDLPAVFGAEHRKPVGRLGRRPAWIFTRRTDLLNAIERIGDHPEPGLRGRELIGDEVACLGLTARAASEDEPLVVVARRPRRRVVVHPRHVAVVVAIVGGGSRRQAGSCTRDRSGDEQFANHDPPSVSRCGGHSSPPAAWGKHSQCRRVHKGVSRDDSG